MRSRAVRLTVCTLIWLAFGASAGFLFYSEQHLSTRRSMLRAFDVHAREAVDALADVRAGQEAYVAAGQGITFWMPKVSALIDAATTAVEGSREAAASPAGVASLEEATTTITEFGDVDKRARDYLKSNQQLMAGDVVFTEGSETATAATRQVQAAGIAEHQAFDAFEAGQRRLEVYALAGAGALGALGLLIVALAGGSRPVETEGARNAPANNLPRAELPALKAAAELCTEFGRVKDLDDLRKLLGQAAETMEASGLIVWLGNASGADLRPVLAHGYATPALARMPLVARAADNAAAAAYRTGSLQIVLARPGASSGAIVAPLLSPDGCIGALTAEIKGGGETSDSAQSLAAIFAAQLAGVLGAGTNVQGSSAESTPAAQRAANS
jgi:hypothetical protein